MALFDDSVTITLLAAAAFFVALSFGLLLRYRQVSQRMSESSDLGRDLWNALEQRMRKQDERILDMMGRLEVLQSRVLAATTPPPTAPPPVSTSPPLPPQPQTSPQRQEARVNVVTSKEPEPIMQHIESQHASHESQISQASSSEIQLDEMQLAAIRLLTESPKNTRQLTDVLKKSREHTARVMKELFEWGLVQRNDSTKPFVYQLTDKGRTFVSEN